ncbi:MAG: hypothetical protein ABI565_01130 [Vicinamibacteria bacterium]
MNVPLPFRLVAILSLSPALWAQEPPPAQWLRLDPLPAEMPLTPRESFDGVPPRFVLLTDGSVFVGGRRDVLRGSLDKAEMQAMSTRLSVAVKAHNQAGAPKTLSLGEGPAIFRFSVLLGAPLQVEMMGKMPPGDGPALPPMEDFIRRLAGFRHPSLRPYDAAQFTLFVREKVLPGGCRTAKGLPPLAQATAVAVVVPEVVTRSFPTGPDMAQVCEGRKRYIVVFQPLIPGGRD